MTFEELFCQEMWGRRVRFFGRDDRSDRILMRVFGDGWPITVGLPWQERYRKDKASYLRALSALANAQMPSRNFTPDPYEKRDSFPLVMGRIGAGIPIDESGALPDFAVARNALGWRWDLHTRQPFRDDGTYA